MRPIIYFDTDSINIINFIRAGTSSNRSPPPIVTDREIGPDGITPTEHEIVYYKTCLACREQQELCKVRDDVKYCCLENSDGVG